jgi:hypothetical protein
MALVLDSLLMDVWVWLLLQALERKLKFFYGLIQRINLSFGFANGYN